MLKQAAGDIALTLMTPCHAVESGPGELTLQPAGLRINFDAQVFQAVIEEIRIDDAHLRSSWGDRLYRILLKCGKPPMEADWRLRLRTA